MRRRAGPRRVGIDGACQWRAGVGPTRAHGRRAPRRLDLPPDSHNLLRAHFASLRIAGVLVQWRVELRRPNFSFTLPGRDLRAGTIAIPFFHEYHKRLKLT